MFYFFLIVVSLPIFGFLVFRLPQFGAKPKGRRLKSIRNLPNYSKGEIRNLSHTPAKAENVSWASILWKFIKGNKKAVPGMPLPSEKPDFSQSEELKITWFGHSSYLLQVDGTNILVDPVFSKRTSPFSFLGSPNFKGTDFVEITDLPPIDILLITHDHYDHLDYKTVCEIKNKTKAVITSLGVGAHLERWGFGEHQINELSWQQNLEIGGLEFTAATARHFSGRGFKRNQTLWSSFILQTKKYKLFLGGDSGYDKHFKTIGKTHGPFDLAILECGQYNTAWPYIHMFPAQVLLAAGDLRAQRLLPVHWGKFKLSIHNWDEPIKQLVACASQSPISVMKPKLGQSFNLYTNFDENWWESVEHHRQTK